MTITAYCHRSSCNHHQVLDLEKLRDRFGPDAPTMNADIVPRLKCAKCSGKQTSDMRRMRRKVFGMAGPGRSLYAKAKGG